MCTIWWKRANETNIQLSWSGNNSISYNQSPSKYVCVLHPRSKVSKVLSTSIVRLIQLSFPAILAGLNWKLIYCGCSRDRDDSKQGWLIANVNSSGGIADEDHHHHQVRERGTAAVTGVAHRRWLSSFPAAAPRVSSGSLCWHEHTKTK